MFTVEPVFKRDKKGKLRVWFGHVDNDGTVHMFSGVDGSSNLVEESYQAEPTNVGKKNERDQFSQGVFELTARLKAKMDKERYQDSREKAMGYESWDVMLAKDYTDGKNSEKVKYGKCDAQMKLDGLRCKMYGQEDKVVAYSRKGKVYQIPELMNKEINDLASKLKKDIHSIDGEMYIHGMHLKDINSLVKNTKKEQRNELIFSVFDFLPLDRALDWGQRSSLLYGELSDIVKGSGYERIQVVPMRGSVKSESEAEQIHYEFLKSGYEGIMLRNHEGLYGFGERSYDLQKWKIFKDAEFPIVGLQIDKRGLGQLVVMLPNGTTLPVDCNVPQGVKKNFVDNFDAKYKGKLLTVKFQDWTPDGSLEFPRGVTIRDYE